MKLGHRIIVLGCPGSGKSTFSRKLHEITGLPLFHLDNIWWNPDRSHISREEFDGRLDELLHLDCWIIDGDYSRTYETRFKACDTVFFLDCSFEECMRGISERIGKARSDIPWINHEPDPELEMQVEDYAKMNRPVVLALLEKYSDKDQIILRSRQEADEWLECFRKQSVQQQIRQ